MKQIKTEFKGIEDLKRITDISLNDILANLLDGEHNLDLKTHIFNPKDLASLKVLGKDIDYEGYKGSAKTLKKFIKIYLRYMVSYDRLSRDEITKAIASLLDKETIRMNISEKLTTTLK